MVRPSFLREIALTAGAILGLACIGLSVAGWLFGVHLLVFRSGSMSPTIGAGGAALAHHVGVEDVRVGDIVSVHDRNGVRVTHRVVGIERHGSAAALTLKGDANGAPDREPYVVDSVDRVFWHVNGLGFVVHAFASRWALLLTAIAAAGLLLLGFSGGSGGGGGGRRRGRAPARAAARGPRRAAHRRRVAAMVVVVVGLGGAVAAPAVAAGWTDGAGVRGAAITTYTVPKPPTLGCKVSGGLLQPYSATISWTAVSTPYAFGYTATIDGVPIAIQSSGSTRSISFNAGILTNLLGNLLGNSVTVAVHTTLSGGSGASAWTWTSAQASTRVVNVSLLGLAWTCGATS